MLRNKIILVRFLLFSLLIFFSLGNLTSAADEQEIWIKANAFGSSNLRSSNPYQRGINFANAYINAGGDGTNLEVEIFNQARNFSEHHIHHSLKGSAKWAYDENFAEDYIIKGGDGTNLEVEIFNQARNFSEHHIHHSLKGSAKWGYDEIFAVDYLNKGGDGTNLSAENLDNAEKFARDVIPHHIKSNSHYSWELRFAVDFVLHGGDSKKLSLDLYEELIVEAKRNRPLPGNVTREVLSAKTADAQIKFWNQMPLPDWAYSLSQVVQMMRINTLSFEGQGGCPKVLQIKKTKIK